MGSSICTIVDVASEVDDVEMEARELEEISSHEQMVKATVYHNDYLMQKIIKFLPPIRERLKLDLVSLRFQELSRQTVWTTPDRSFEKLELYAPNEFTSVKILLGSFNKSIEEKDCSYMLKTILWKLLVYKTNVRIVIYGSQRSPYPDYNGTLVLTRELISYLNNFTLLKTLVLRNSDVEEDAIEYLVSNECQFTNLIENLSIEDMLVGPWVSHLIGKKLRTLSVQIHHFSIASALVQKMDQLDLVLESINITVSAFRIAGNEREIALLNALSKRCSNLTLVFWNNLNLARNIQKWTNITGLTIDTGSSHDLTDLPMTLEDIKYLTQLERLTISEIFNQAAFISSRNGIQDLTKLKYLKITDHAPKNEFGINAPFFESLPLCLEEIELDKFHWETEAIEKFSNRAFRKLTKLTIRRPYKFGKKGSEVFVPLITRFQSLEMFHFFDTIETEMINHVIEHPNLNDVIVSAWSAPRREMMAELMSKFKTNWMLHTSEYTNMQFSKGRMCPIPLLDWNRT